MTALKFIVSQLREWQADQIFPKIHKNLAFILNIYRDSNVTTLSSGVIKKQNPTILYMHVY